MLKNTKWYSQGCVRAAPYPWTLEGTTISRGLQIRLELVKLRLVWRVWLFETSYRYYRDIDTAAMHSQYDAVSSWRKDSSYVFAVLSNWTYTAVVELDDFLANVGDTEDFSSNGLK